MSGYSDKSQSSDGSDELKLVEKDFNKRHWHSIVLIDYFSSVVISYIEDPNHRHKLSTASSLVYQKRFSYSAEPSSFFYRLKKVNQFYSSWTTYVTVFVLFSFWNPYNSTLKPIETKILNLLEPTAKYF